MIFIIFVKTLLIIASIATLGLLPLAALLNMWIWNEIIVKSVLTCAKPIYSFWIIMGLTLVGAMPIVSIVKMFRK